jgi:hypothetical protein
MLPRPATLAAWLVSLVCALPACGGGGSGGPDAGDDGGDDAPFGPDDGAVSGSRLKLNWIDFSGTRVGGVQAHDTAIDADCYPAKWNDGASRCTPISGGVIAYRDAGCTQTVGVNYLDPTCPTEPADFFQMSIYSACDGGIAHVYHRGDAVALTGYYEMIEGMCYGPYASPGLSFHELGAEVLPDTLAPLVLGQPIGTGRYRQRFWESADGARLFARAADDVLGTDCYLQRYLDTSTGTCSPMSVRYTQNFADATCTQPALANPAGCDAPEYIGHYPTIGVCPEDAGSHYYPVAGTTTTIYRRAGAACELATPDPTATYLVSGPELVIPELALAIDDEAGRQLQLAHVIDGSSRVRAYGQYDVVNDVDCYIVPEGDGHRCIPYRSGPVTFFADATCTTTIELVEVYSEGGSCDEPAPPRFTMKVITGCPTTYEVYRVGPRYAAPVYANDGACLEVTDPTQIRYQLGELVPQTAFPAGTAVTDP